MVPGQLAEATLLADPGHFAICFRRRDDTLYRIGVLRRTGVEGQHVPCLAILDDLLEASRLANDARPTELSRLAGGDTKLYFSGAPIKFLVVIYWAFMFHIVFWVGHALVVKIIKGFRAENKQNSTKPTFCGSLFVSRCYGRR